MTQPRVLRAVRLTAQEYDSRKSTQRVLSAAKEEADRIIRDARAAAEAIKTEAEASRATLQAQTLDAAELTLKKFLLDKRDEAEPEMVRTIFDQIDFIRADYAKHEEWIAEVTIQGVERIIGRIKRDSVLKRIVETAIMQFGRRWTFKLYTAPTDLAEVRRVVSEGPGTINAVEDVIAHPELEPGRLLLRGPEGICDLSLIVQIKTLREVFAGDRGAPC